MPSSSGTATRPQEGLKTQYEVKEDAAVRKWVKPFWAPHPCLLNWLQKQGLLKMCNLWDELNFNMAKKLKLRIK